MAHNRRSNPRFGRGRPATISATSGLDVRGSVAPTKHASVAPNSGLTISQSQEPNSPGSPKGPPSPLLTPIASSGSASQFVMQAPSGGQPATQTSLGVAFRDAWCREFEGVYSPSALNVVRYTDVKQTNSISFSGYSKGNIVIVQYLKPSIVTGMEWVHLHIEQTYDPLPLDAYLNYPDAFDETRSWSFLVDVAPMLYHDALTGSASQLAPVKYPPEWPAKYPKQADVEKDRFGAFGPHDLVPPGSSKWATGNIAAKAFVILRVLKAWQVVNANSVELRDVVILPTLAQDANAKLLAGLTPISALVGYILLVCPGPLDLVWNPLTI